jgi:hypothetical protein
MGFLSSCNAVELKRAMCYGTSSIHRGRAKENESVVTVRAVRDTEEIVATAKTLLSLILKLKPTLLDDNALTNDSFYPQHCDNVL